MAKYTIKKGDTLYSIAKNNNTTVSELAKRNSIADANKIYEGATIDIPDTAVQQQTTGVKTLTGGGNASIGAVKATTPTTPKAATPTTSAEALNAYNAGAAAVQKPSDYKVMADVEQMYNEVMDTIGKGFSYDFNADQTYKNLAEQYAKQGQMAMKDTMGQAAAMNGGYGSSFGQTAGQQVYNNYMQELAGYIPELEEQAYGRWQDKVANLKDQYGMAVDRDREAYSRYIDNINAQGAENDRLFNLWQALQNQENVDREYNTNEYWNQYNADRQVERDKVADYQWEESHKLDKASQKLASDKFDYEKGITDKEMAASLLTSGLKLDADGNVVVDPDSAYFEGDGDGGDFERYTFAQVDEDGKYVFYRDGKKYTLDKGVNPYTGTTNPDAENGTFSNGYQPNNIGGDKLSKKEGEKVYFNGGYQSIWLTPDGTEWYWDGSQNCYLKLEDEEE